MADRTFAEFFAGIGLARIGLEAAGWTAVFANDIDKGKRSMYEHHFGDDGGFRLDDVAELKPADVPEVDLAWASFPCVDLSLAGWGRGLDGEDSGTFWPFTTLIEAMERRPPLIVVENVAGFATSRGGTDFAKALLRMNDLGYIVDVLQVDAVHFVPQSRPRLFIVCSEIRDREAEAWDPSPVRPAWVRKFRDDHPELDMQARAMPSLPPLTRRPKLSVLMEKLPEDSELWWSQKRHKHLLSQMNRDHRRRAEWVAQGAGKSERFATVYKRVREGVTRAEVRIDGVAGCLRTPRGGSSRQIVLAGTDGKLRSRHMTPREYAALMGAPEYRMSEDLPVNQALWGFGDAVVVPAVSWLAANYLNALM